MAKAKIVAARAAGWNHQVLTATGGGFHYRRKVCKECPWRRDVPTGAFPAEAFRISARTAYDAGLSSFACHMSGKEHPATCAGISASQRSE